MAKINEIAILIDGGFFIQRFKKLNNDRNPDKKDIENLISIILEKVAKKSNGKCEDLLYRTYYYDCLPFGKVLKDMKGLEIDFSKSKTFENKEKFINSLKDID